MKKIIWITFLIFAVFSCERKASEISKVIIELPKRDLVAKSENSLNTIASGPAPATWSELDCFVFMVTGPEAKLKHNSCPMNDGFTGMKVGSFEFGLTFAGYSFNETAEFEIASGTDREISVIGFKTNLTGAAAVAACKNILTTDHPSISKAYIVAKSGKLKIEPGSTQSVPLTINYTANSTPFLGDCSGPTSPGSGNNTPAGPPVKVKVRLQDDLTSVTSAGCVALAIDLLDANGNLATVTEDYQFTLSGGGSNLFTLDGNYCDGAALSSRTINFYNGANRFNRVVLFLLPPSPAIYNFSLAQTTPALALTQELTPYQVVAAANPSLLVPYKINIFDVNAFRSTHSSSGSNPIDVKPDECRAAVVQVLDNLGRPLKITNNAGVSNFIYSNIMSISSPANQVEFYTANPCVGSTPTHLYSLDGGFYTISGFNRFFYKVPSTAAGTIFNLKVDVTENGFYDSANPIVDLDPTSATNNKSVWRVKN